MTRARDVANLIGSGNYSSTTFTATAGQTAFTISHTQGFVQVFMNGLLLDETVDYTSNGSAITLTSGAAAGDEIEVVKYNTFSVGDALPKSGGTMTGDLTIDTNTFHVDVADNRLGIGTSTPTKKLTISENAAAGEGILLSNEHNQAGTYSDIRWQYQPNETSYSSGIRFKQVDTTHGGQLEFYTDNASGTYTKQMQITENGHVTMPNQPCFLARGNTGGWVTVSSGNETNVAFGNVVWDIGSNFSTSNNRFTAPVAGKYLFHFHCYMRLSSYDDDTNYATTRFYKNGSVYENFHNILGYQNSGDSDQIGPLTAIIDLAATDYVNAGLKANSGDAQFYQPNCNFTGYLIG